MKDDKNGQPKTPSKKKKIRIIQKESALTAIYASGNLTTQQKKVFNAFIYIGKEHLKSSSQEIEDGFEVPVSYLKSIIGDTSNNYSFLKKTVETLQDFTVESNVLGKDTQKWDRFSLVAGATIADGQLRFSFPHQVINALKNPKMYVTLDLDEINRIERKYAISLYEIIEDYKKLNRLPKWTINDFKKALDIREDSYATFRDLHRRVVVPAVREINDKFNMGLEYILYSNLMMIHSKDLEDEDAPGKKKKRRMPKITHIQFVLTKKEQLERGSYKAYVEKMRLKYAPMPEKDYYPVITKIEGKDLMLNLMGRLYFMVGSGDEQEVEELTPQESDKYWKMLWKEEMNKKEDDEVNDAES